MPGLLPIFLDLTGALVVVSGDTGAASAFARRATALGATVRRAGASPDEDLAGATLVALGSAEAGADADLAAAARSKGLLVVSLLPGGAGRAFTGETAGDGGVLLAVTTRGASLELEQRVASDAAKALRPEHPRFASILASVRAKLEERFPDETLRAAIWQQILDSPVLVLLEAGQDDEALEMAERMAWGTG